MEQQKKTGGCQESCPLGKVLGQKECPGKKAKERLLGWLRGQAKDEEPAPGEGGQGR